MAMTKREYLAKEQILRKLNKEGYPTYSRLLDEFDVNLTQDPNVVAYMEPGKGRIVLNSGLDIDQVSTITRHEILHQYLEHENRLLKKLASSTGQKFDDLDDNSINELKRKLYGNSNFNIAGDYEISNRGYTDKDKRIARSIRLNGQVLKGLVTEDDHPDWVDLPIEDMYDKLNQQMEQEQKKAQQQQQQQGDEGEDNQEGNQSGQQGQQSQSDGGQSNQSNSKGQETQDDGQSSGQDSNQQQSKGSKGSGKSKAPQIGDKGDEATQAAEQAEREANDISKEMQKAKEAAQAAGNDQKADVAQDAKDIADAAADEASSVADDAPEDMRGKGSDIDARLERIKRMLNDANMAAKAVNEAEYKVNSEKAAKAAVDAEKYKNTPIKRFRDNLNHFIRNQVSTGREQSWSRINKKYADSGIIRPGTTRQGKAKIPLINVYFDRSGSWDDGKIKVGEEAIGTLNQYVQRHEIAIKLYYFSNNVHTDKNKAAAEGGTRGEPILRHIQETKPDNVIVMTDSDIVDCRSDVTIPGAVWFLFKGGRSQNLVDHLHGKAETKEFDLN